MNWKDQLEALKNSGELAPAQEEGIEDVAKEPTPKTSTVQTAPILIVQDKKGRKGKTATIIEGLELEDEKVEELAAELKKKLGCGGSVRDGEILVQGEKGKEIKEFLLNKGYKIKTQGF